MKRVIRTVPFILIIMLLLAPNANAFNTVLAWKLDDPENINTQISTTVSQYASKIITYTNTWESYCPQIGFTTGGICNIYYYGDLATYTGSYASAYTSSNNYKTITFHGHFKDASDAIKNEVIVHEVGHALGLAHCDERHNSISVMRAEGFNGLARPLSDDMDGIASLYIQ